MIDPSILLGTSTAILAFLSWRAGAVTPIEEKENILHQRWGDSSNDGGKGLRGDNHSLQVYSLVVRETTGLRYIARKYLSGDSEGATEINLIVESNTTPSIKEYEAHPWYDEVGFRVAKIGERPDGQVGDVSMTIVVWSAEASEIQYQLQYFGQVTDHILNGQLADKSSIPDFGEFGFENVERSSMLT